LEALGWYNPIEVEDEQKLSVKSDRVQHWLNLGAELTENAASLVKRVAPEVMRAQRDKQLVQKAKAAAKRKTNSKAA
jgi:small subunit ribosomal protein S16